MIQLTRALYTFNNQLKQYYEYRTIRPSPFPITTPVSITKRPVIIPTTRPAFPSPLGADFAFGMSQLRTEMANMKKEYQTTQTRNILTLTKLFQKN
jgi:hypothetical protein